MNRPKLSHILLCALSLGAFEAVTTVLPQGVAAQMQTGWEHTYAPPNHPTVLHAARLLEIESGRIISPGEVLVRGDKIAEVRQLVTHPADARIIDLGDTTLMPGLIDAQ